ncbi:MAG TPA: hypothetical protein VFA60_10515 [Terriglobales bacterium]|nr:hypothetical protein [Terriglobales bacterium]
MKRAAAVFLFVLLGWSIPVPAWQLPPAPDASQGRVGRPRDRAQDEQIERLEREQEKRRNKQRQEELQKDTDKLLELATQLKQYVDKSNEHLLSIDVVRKAEEIEKLAHSVKDKMKSGL